MYKTSTQDHITLGFGTLKFHENTWIQNTHCAQEFLYEDLESLPEPPSDWIEIDLIEVPERARRRGIGSALINLLKSRYPDTPIIAKVGCTSEEEYESINAGDMQDYLNKNKVPFYEYNGFVNINDTPLGQSEYVIMVYPKSFANKRSVRI